MRLASLQEVIALPGALRATLEHVSLTPTAATAYWYIVEDEEGWIGFGAWMPMKSTARIKGIYVRPERRGEGHGERLSLALVQEAAAAGFTRLDQFAAAPDWWLARGWTPSGPRRPNGVQHLRLTFQA